MKPLRFCMVTTFYPPHNFGGDGIGVQRLARALVRRGHSVTVLCNTDAYEVLRDGPTPKSVDNDGVVVRRVRSWSPTLDVVLMQQTGRSIVTRRKLNGMLDRESFDVINYHNISLAGGPGILSAGRAVKLYTAWEHWLVCPTHVLWRHAREACVGRQCLRCTLRYRRPPQLWRYTGLLERQLRHVDAFIALSEFSRAKHKEFGFPRDMEVIPGFLPDAASSEPSVQSERPQDRPYFLFVGRLERLKGLDDVIPVFETYPNADLLIIGEGTHGAALRDLARENPRVRFLGRLPVEETGRYYSHAIATLVPSVGFETFGYVVIESFSRSTPVIARRIGPLPELVARCGGGETFDTPQKLAAAMHRLQSDLPYRNTLARAALEGFHSNWTESAVVPQYLELVDRLSGTTRSRSYSAVESAVGTVS